MIKANPSMQNSTVKASSKNELLAAASTTQYKPTTCLSGDKRKRDEPQDNVSREDDDSSPHDARGNEENDGLSLLLVASLLQSQGSHRKKAKTATQRPGSSKNKDCSTSTISAPRQMDVLCGRGGGTNKHDGNVMYRRVVEYNKPIYRLLPKRHRMLVSQSIVQAVLNEGGRFLQQEKSIASSSKDSKTQEQPTWKEISFQKAVQKTSQALRERSENEDCAAAVTQKARLSTEEGRARPSLRELYWVGK